MTARDSNGNPFIDFVWGNMPMEPNDDRAVSPITSYFGGGEGDANYDSAVLVTSGKLDDESFNVEVNNVGLEYSTPADNHIIATTNYKGFPEFSQEFPYNDTIPNLVVPNVVNTLGTTAQATLTSAGLTFTSSSTTVGATSSNANKVKTQSPAAGSLVNAGEKITLVTYNYVAPEPILTGPIAGFNRTSAGTSFNVLNGDDAIMYVVGQTVKPTAGTFIVVQGASDSQFNRRWAVVAVENNNSYNTGGTAIKITVAGGPTFTGTAATGGTWTVSS
jgi:hypothetical protein